MKKGKSRRAKHRQINSGREEPKRQTIRKEKESQDSSDRDGQGTWNYLGFSECHSLEKESQNVKVRGFAVGGGTKKEGKEKKQQEVKEKQSAARERSAWSTPGTNCRGREENKRMWDKSCNTRRTQT